MRKGKKKQEYWNIQVTWCFGKRHPEAGWVVTWGKVELAAEELNLVLQEAQVWNYQPSAEHLGCSCAAWWLAHWLCWSPSCTGSATRCSTLCRRARSFSWRTWPCCGGGTFLSNFQSRTTHMGGKKTMRVPEDKNDATQNHVDGNGKEIGELHVILSQTHQSFIAVAAVVHDGVVEVTLQDRRRMLTAIIKRQICHIAAFFTSI